MPSAFDADGPAQLRQLFESHLDAGLHHGAQLAVYRDGDPLVDLAGGTTGPDGDATTPDTRHVLFSCTKPFAGACVHRLVEEGALAYDDPVVDHWPEYADDGSAKAETTVRHVLGHRAGVPVADVDERPDLWDDPDAIARSMENADLAFEPGSTAAYHALTYGWLVGELVRRASGTPIDEYLREHVLDPLGLERTALGLPADEPDDVATLVGFAEFDRCRRPDVGLDALENDEAAMLFNREETHRAVVPAASGVGTAREMARFYACLANGGELDGARILDPETVDAATAVQVEVEEDGTLGVPRRWALGFARGGTVWDDYGAVSPPGVFGHGGLGSSVGWADPDEGLAFAYVTDGIRDAYENGARMAAMGDAVRTALT